jgi:hypothetical protein
MTLRARWVTLRARWVIDAKSSLGDAKSSLGDAKIPVSDVQEEREERRPVQAAKVVRTTRWTITRRMTM